MFCGNPCIALRREPETFVPLAWRLPLSLRAQTKAKSRKLTRLKSHSPRMTPFYNAFFGSWF
jgi:hypothetical protein